MDHILVESGWYGMCYNRELFWIESILALCNLTITYAYAYLLRVQWRLIPPLFYFLTLPLALCCGDLSIHDMSYELILSERNLDRRSSARPLAQLQSNRIDSDHREPSECVLAAPGYLRLVIMVGKM